MQKNAFRFINMTFKLFVQKNRELSICQLFQKVTFFSICFLIISGCGGSSGSSQTLSRPFYMGFTPWPYDSTIAAVENTYTKINENGDLVAHHLDGGIPWDEALGGSSYHVNVESELSTRLTKTQTDKVVYLAVNPLNSDKTNIADHWGATTGEGLSTWKNWHARQKN